VALTDCVCMHGHGVQDANNFACVPCPRGTYKEDRDRQACAACPANTDTLQVGAFEAQECVSRAGYRMVYDAGGLGTASACPGGTYSDHVHGRKRCVVCGMREGEVQEYTWRLRMSRVWRRQVPHNYRSYSTRRLCELRCGYILFGGRCFFS
jgi:ribosomal protein S14